MKTLAALIFFVSTITVNSFAQNLIVIYEQKTIMNPLLAKSAPHLLEKDYTQRHSLKISGGKSLFVFDSIIVNVNSNSDYRMYSTSEVIYKDYTKNEWLMYRGRYPDKAILKMNLNEINAKMAKLIVQKDVKKICGIECRKAVNNDGWEVWFAPSIPIDDGPAYGKHHLKGLVLEMKNQSSKYTAISLTYKKSNIVRPIFNESYDNIDKIPLKGYRDLPRDKMIKITKDTPIDTWLKFDN